MNYCATVMAGGFHVPSMIDGGVSFGQCIRQRCLLLARLVVRYGEFHLHLSLVLRG